MQDTDLLSLYAITDVYVQPSITEGFGFAAARALSAGVPVVATKVGAVPEVIRDGADGILVEFGNTGAMVEAILKQLENPLRPESANGQQLVNRFSWKTTTSQTLAVYANLIERYG